jgi:hypothetical protein
LEENIDPALLKMKAMKTTRKMQIALFVAICLIMSFVFWEPDPNSPTGLAGICGFLVATYFFFRYNNQIKQQIKLGCMPEPTAAAKRKHFWALSAGLCLGALTGSVLMVCSLFPILGIIYSLLALISYDLFMAYLVYWLWRKFYRAS